MTVRGGVRGLDVDGVEFHIAPDSVKYSVEDKELESVLGSQGKIGDTEAGVAPYIEAKVFLDASQTAEQLKVRDKTVILRLTDRTVTLTGATTVGRVEPDGKERSCTVKFEGIRGREVSV